MSLREDSVNDANIEVTSSEWKRKDYTVKLVPDYQVVVVWDCRIRRKLSGPNGCYLANRDFLSANPSASCFKDVYKELRPNGCFVGYEKVMVVGVDHIEDFLVNLDDYMEQNPYDANFLPKKDRLGPCVVSSIGMYGERDSASYSLDENSLLSTGDAKRRRYSTSYYARKSGFREQVLDSYGRRCAICRLDVEEVLEAAHRHGRTVAEGSYFDICDGVCLCANHHKMYDRHLFEIDFASDRLYDVEERLKESDWYRRLYDRFDGLVVRQEMQERIMC